MQHHPPLRYKCCASTAPAAHTLTLLSQEQSQKHLMLCKLKNDSDWAENGEIIKKEQMQSEYWVSDSLLISQLLPRRRGPWPCRL